MMPRSNYADENKDITNLLPKPRIPFVFKPPSRRAEGQPTERMPASARRVLCRVPLLSARLHRCMSVKSFEPTTHA